MIRYPDIRAARAAGIPVPSESPPARHKIPKPDSLAQKMLYRTLQHVTDTFWLWEYRPFAERDFRCDMAAETLKLDVEVDEFTVHKTLRVMNHDRARDVYFQRQGWFVFRVTDVRVYKDLSAVLREIQEVLAFRGRSYVSSKR